MNVDEFVSASEAARMLGVTRQRVSAMIRDGDLPAVHPWPRAVRINRQHLAAWAAGERPVPVHRTATRNYVLYEADVDSIDELSIDQLRALCLRFIGQRRPLWSADEARTWADQMADQLTARS